MSTCSNLPEPALSRGVPFWVEPLRGGAIQARAFLLNSAALKLELGAQMEEGRVTFPCQFHGIAADVSLR